MEVTTTKADAQDLVIEQVDADIEATSSTTTLKKPIKPTPIYDFFKRATDLFCSFLAIIILSPIFLIISIIVKCTSKGPVFFKHTRVGKHGKPINILKFRSMVQNSEELIKKFTPEQMEEYKKNFKLENDPRVTKIGNILRKTSLDELPQLINILKSDISIVGPRPIMEKETLLYGENRDLLLSVKPGLTGNWAANGRSTVDYQTRIKLELEYIEKRSYWFDVKLIFKTIISVFKKEGAL